MKEVGFLVYFSLFLSLFYLMSCPLIAIADVKNFENLYVFFPMLQVVAYLLYLYKKFKYDYKQSHEGNFNKLQDRTLENYFNIFNVLYFVFLIGLSYLTMNVIILSFVLYPLGLKVSVINALFINDRTYRGLTKIGEK